MEFNLRVQEFIELVRTDRRLDAVKHARKYFANYDDYQLQEIQCCMGQLAFPAHAYLSPYKDLLDEKRFAIYTFAIYKQTLLSYLIHIKLLENLVMI